MYTGALCGLLIALVVFAITYIQAENEINRLDSLAGFSRPRPNLPVMAVLLIICVGLGASIGANFNG